MDAEVMLNAMGRICLESPCCNECSIREFCTTCTFLSKGGAKELIKIIENWLKAHPAKTNAQKFYEVFGEVPAEVPLELMDDDGGIVYVSSEFWTKEYVPSMEKE